MRYLETKQKNYAALADCHILFIFILDYLLYYTQVIAVIYILAAFLRAEDKIIDIQY